VNAKSLTSVQAVLSMTSESTTPEIARWVSVKGGITSREKMLRRTRKNERG